MKRLSYIFLIFAATLSLAWALPWIYNLLLPDPSQVPFISYSPLSGEFIATEKGKSWVINPDGSHGRDLPMRLRDSLLPQQYYVQLSNFGRLPDTILGKEVSPKILKHGNFMFRSSPRDVNKRYADVYMIMESKPPRVEFDDPSEVFRMKDDGTVEFIRIADCSINTERTKEFTKVFADRKFAFPMRDFSANVTTRKPYDAGYLLIDNNGRLYNMLQQGGGPFLKAIALPDSAKATKALVMEDGDGSNIGFATDENGATYAIGADYSVHRLDIGSFNPQKDNLLVMGSIFNWIVRIANERQISWQVVDNTNFSRIAELVIPQTESTLETVASYIFPFTIAYDSYNDSFACLRIEDISAKALILNSLLAIAIGVIAYRRRKSPTALITSSVLTLCLGVFVFIPLLTLNDN